MPTRPLSELADGVYGLKHLPSARAIKALTANGKPQPSDADYEVQTTMLATLRRGGTVVVLGLQTFVGWPQGSFQPGLYIDA